MTKPSHTIFTVRERGEDKAFWLAIGSAWTNRDGSLNLSFDALPVDAKAVLRLRKEKNTTESEAQD